MTEPGLVSIRVVVVAADRLARAGLTAVFEAADVTVAESMGLGHGPPADADVCVIDWGWTRDAVDAATALAEQLPVLSLVADSEGVAAAWSAGSSGVLLRDAAPRTLLAAASGVAAGLRLGDADTLSQPVHRTDQLLEPLTQREEEVLALLAEGLSNRQIGAKLGISENTVKFHVNALLGKLNADSRTEAAMRAARLGLVRI